MHEAVFIKPSPVSNNNILNVPSQMLISDIDLRLKQKEE
jgi:hypothetical protein